MRRPFTTVPRLAILLTALATVTTLTGCQAPSPAPQTVSTQPPPAAAGGPTTTAATTAWPTDSSGNPVGWQVCRNAVKHFEIAYPGGWHTASVGADDACAAFDPAPFTVSDGPGIVTQQLFAFYQSQDALDYLTELFPPDFYTVNSRTDVTVAGLHGFRYNVTTLPPRGPSGVPYPAGSTIYGYVVTTGARSIDVGCWVAPADAGLLPARQHIVDQAVTTIHFT